MPPFRPKEHISEARLREAVSRIPVEQHVLWTGGSYGSLTGSLRSQALAMITERMMPIPVRELVRRAARIDGDYGFDPDTVRHGLNMHKGAKPCVYWILNRAEDDSFVAGATINHPDGYGAPIKKGQPVLASDGSLFLAGDSLGSGPDRDAR